MILSSELSCSSCSEIGRSQEMSWTVAVAGRLICSACDIVWMGQGWMGRYLGAQLHWVARQNIARLAYGVVDELDVAVQYVAAHVFDQTAQVADRHRLHLVQANKQNNRT